MCLREEALLAAQYFHGLQEELDPFGVQSWPFWSSGVDFQTPCSMNSKGLFLVPGALL